MALSYDVEIFNQFKVLSIQNPSQFLIDEKYYSNTYPYEFIFKRKINEYERIKLNIIDSNKIINDGVIELLEHAYKSKHIYKWIVCETLCDKPSRNIIISLYDRNIGASYNPWLIFDSEQTAKDARKMLEVTFTN